MPEKLKPCPFCGGEAYICGEEITDYCKGVWAPASRKEYSSTAIITRNAWLLPKVKGSSSYLHFVRDLTYAKSLSTVDVAGPWAKIA